MASVGGLSMEMKWAAQEDATAPAPVLHFAKILAIVILFNTESLLWKFVWKWQKY